MIDKIISKIEEERIKKGISESGLAKLIEVDQNKVWRCLNRKTKRPDVELLEKMQEALGMVSEPEMPYTSTKQDDLTLDEIEKILIRKIRERGRGAAARWVAELLEEEETKKAAE